MKINDAERAVAALASSSTVLTPAEAVRMIHTARTTEKPLAQILLENVSESKLLETIAEELGLPFVDLYATNSTFKIEDDLVRRADIEMLKQRSALPVRDSSDRIVVAMANPRADQDMVDYLHGLYAEGMIVGLASTQQIQSKLVYFDSPDLAGLSIDSSSPEPLIVASATTIQPQSPVVEWVDNLLSRATAEGASDVHFMMQQDGSLLVRFRIDGILRRQNMPLRRREGEVIGTLLSRCPTIDPSDKTRPQDGTFSFLAAGGRQIDTRLAMLPQLHGPTVTVRLLDPRNVRRKLDDMGFSKDALTSMRKAASSPQGLILMIGPTGSGKTTTLYGLLNEQDTEHKNVLTAEDPVEYRLPNIGQTQIRSDLGDKSLTFARALRAFLRLDPDVILVGEIRDAETAEVAMHAALTGHLVLSTVHANSALNVYQRLEELGGEPYLVAEALTLAVSQRLIRKVHDCSTMEEPTVAEKAFLNRHSLEIPELVARTREGGCPGCSGTGYRGRIPVVEYLEPSPKVRDLVSVRSPQAEVYAAAAESGWKSILHDAHRHVLSGGSTVAELLRCLDTGGSA